MKVHKQLLVRLQGPPPRSDLHGQAHKQRQLSWLSVGIASRRSWVQVPLLATKPASQLGRFALFLSTCRTWPWVGPTDLQSVSRTDTSTRSFTGASVECPQAFGFESRVRRQEAACPVRLTRKVAQLVERLADEREGRWFKSNPCNKTSLSTRLPLNFSIDARRTTSQALVGSSPTLPTTTGR